MSKTNPKNVSEWVSFIGEEIPREDLLHQARVIASPTFQTRMEEEGYAASDLLAMYRAVSLRFLKEKMRLPGEMSGTSVNYQELARHNIPSTGNNP